MTMGAPRGVKILNEEWPQKGAKGTKRRNLRIQSFLSLLSLFAANAFLPHKNPAEFSGQNDE